MEAHLAVRAPNPLGASQDAVSVPNPPVCQQRTSSQSSQWASSSILPMTGLPRVENIGSIHKPLHNVSTAAALVDTRLHDFGDCSLQSSIRPSNTLVSYLQRASFQLQPHLIDPSVFRSSQYTPGTNHRRNHSCPGAGALCEILEEGPHCTQGGTGPGQFEEGIRSLTNEPDAPDTIMTTNVSAPGSPPELSESRSSKSSSYGSQSSGTEGISSDAMHFEEIGLDDEKPPEQGAAARVSARDRSPPEQENVRREKHGATRPKLANVRTQNKACLQSVENGVRSMRMGPVKRGFTSPAVPQSADPIFRTRSSSPHHRPSMPASAATTGKSCASPNSTLAPPSRRSSWQPARKPARDIEAEYRDSDDDLPDDASLFNVPISPFPSGHRSGTSSARGSPERDAPPVRPRPIPLQHATTAPESSQRHGAYLQSLPRYRLTPRSSSTNPSPSKPASPQTGSFRKTRTKSWNLAMGDLSDEARIISENLELHSEYASLPALLAANPLWGPQRSSAPGAIELPPVQKSTLDFMPVSKEKAAILSRTRPSWLPPKDPREERKHLQQYQEMMRASMAAEKKRTERLKQNEHERDKTRHALTRVWEFYATPSTDLNAIDSRVHDLCWHGIPAGMRGRVWQRAIGNTLKLTRQSYEKALQRARDVKGKSSEERSTHEARTAAWFVDIERDAETAFPELNVFQPQGPLRTDLIELCEAYACYRGDVGYIYGLQLIAALLLLQIPSPHDAFIALANGLNKPLAAAFQLGDVAAVSRTYQKVLSTLGIKFPRLYEYLVGSHEHGGLALTGEELFEPLFRTIFANGLDVDRLCRVWDIWIFAGDRYLIRTAVALLGSLQAQIFSIEGDVDLKRRNIQEMLGWGPFNRTDVGGYWNLSSLGGEDAFVEEINAASKLDYTGR